MNFSDEKIPKDKDGNQIWKDRKEIVTPSNETERVRLKTFDCELLDSDTGRCKDYENRPEICRHTSCIDMGSSKRSDEQHQEAVEKEFLVLKDKPIQ